MIVATRVLLFVVAITAAFTSAKSSTGIEDYVNDLFVYKCLDRMRCIKN